MFQIIGGKRAAFELSLWIGPLAPVAAAEE
jgi:hypothetical protein